jgi:hypothetical protein
MRPDRSLVAMACTSATLDRPAGDATAPEASWRTNTSHFQRNHFVIGERRKQQ